MKATPVRVFERVDPTCVTRVRAVWGLVIVKSSSAEAAR
jgi:hypothetical protein